MRSNRKPAATEAPARALHLVPTKRNGRVQPRRRVTALTPDQKRRICWLFDSCGGDADYTAERCGFIGVQRGDVLAVVLADTRRMKVAA